MTSMHADLVLAGKEYEARDLHGGLMAQRILDGGYMFTVSTPSKHIAKDADPLPPAIAVHAATDYDDGDDDPFDDKRSLDGNDDEEKGTPETDLDLALYYVYSHWFETEDRDALVHAEYYGRSGGDGAFQVHSRISAEHALEVANELVHKYFSEPPVREIETERVAVPMTFIWNTTRGPNSRFNLIDVHPWDETSKNYAKATQAELNALINHGKVASDEGKLVLLYGPPGTGKTSYLRSLAWAWKDWAEFSIIVDPEQFFGDSGYMINVTLDQGSKYRWLVLEDTGELIAAGAKSKTGQGLSRLLNMADGILGQGQKLGFIITTNEDIDTLDPAVTRPGRCLAQVKVDKFTPDEASEWLGYQVNRDMTLADMYALGSDKVLAPLSAEAIPAGGVYL